MKVLYKSDTDYIPLPSKDPFVQKQQALLIEMGYRLIEDYNPSPSDSPSPEESSSEESSAESTE